jgi:uncharacterized repeat protein (TIGR03803 family)
MKKLFTVLILTLLLRGAIQAQPTLDMLVSFVPWTSAGANPYGGLTLGNDGNFYGTTADGNGDVGTVFQLTTNGTLTTLATFDFSNGDNPLAGLTLGNDGNFYGTTYNGGSNDGAVGSVFQCTTNGTLTTLANFYGTNGANPMAALTLGNDGNFYGTTSEGGAYDYGTVFQVTTNGTLATLANFDYTNGANPMAALTLGNDDNFYGIASEGGTYGDGTVFQITTNGTLTILVSFNNTNGAYGDLYPSSGLALGNDGCFYGTTDFGGLYANQYGSGFGTVFRVTTNGALTTLANFNGTNGAYPQAGLTLASDGSFYGTTFGGGYNNGSVFRVTTNGTLTTVVNFSGTNGSWPMSSLALGTDGNFYGTTEEGGNDYNGENVGAGTVFKLIIPPIINCFSITNHVAKMSISGLARPSVQIQSTTNLFSPWSALANLVFSSGNNQFNDSAASNSPARFYRVMVQ